MRGLIALLLVAIVLALFAPRCQAVDLNLAIGYHGSLDGHGNSPYEFREGANELAEVRLGVGHTYNERVRVWCGYTHYSSVYTWRDTGLDLLGCSGEFRYNLGR